MSFYKTREQEYFLKLISKSISVSMRFAESGKDAINAAFSSKNHLDLEYAISVKNASPNEVLDRVDSSGFVNVTPIRLTIIQDLPIFVEILLYHGVDVKGQRLLQCAVFRERREIVEILLKDPRVDVNEDGDTALHVAHSL